MRLLILPRLTMTPSFNSRRSCRKTKRKKIDHVTAALLPRDAFEAHWLRHAIDQKPWMPLDSWSKLHNEAVAALRSWIPKLQHVIVHLTDLDTSHTKVASISPNLLLHAKSWPITNVTTPTRFQPTSSLSKCVLWSRTRSPNKNCRRLT